MLFFEFLFHLLSIWIVRCGCLISIGPSRGPTFLHQARGQDPAYPDEAAGLRAEGMTNDAKLAGCVDGVVD